MSTAPRSLLSASAAAVLGTGASAALSALYIALGARWLGPAEYGRVGAIVSLANLLFLALNPFEAGLVLTVSAETQRDGGRTLRSYLDRAMRALLFWAGALALVWIGACELLARWGLLDSARSAQWLGVFFVAMMLLCLPRAVQRGRELFISLGINLVLESSLRLCIGLTLLALGAGAAGMVAGYALGTLLSVVHATLYARSGLEVAEDATPPDRAAWLSWYALLLPFRSLSTPLLGVHFYAGVVMNVDVLAAKHYLDAHQAGLYAGAASLTRLVTVGAHPVLLVLFSRLANLSSAHAAAARMMRRASELGGGALLASMLVPLLLGELLLRLFLGPAYAGAAAVLSWQWASACVLTAQSFAADALIATSARVRGSWLLALAAVLISATLLLWHESASTIARTVLFASASVGTAAYYLLWRFRSPVPAANT